MYLLRDNKIIKIDISEDRLNNKQIFADIIDKAKAIFDDKYILQCEISSKQDKAIYIFRSVKNKKYGASGEHNTIGEAINSMIDKATITIHDFDTCVTQIITK